MKKIVIMAIMAMVALTSCGTDKKKVQEDDHFKEINVVPVEVKEIQYSNETILTERIITENIITEKTLGE